LELPFEQKQQDLTDAALHLIPFAPACGLELQGDVLQSNLLGRAARRAAACARVQA
jgi:hypothetical protein